MPSNLGENFLPFYLEPREKKKKKKTETDLNLLKICPESKVWDLK